MGTPTIGNAKLRLMWLYIAVSYIRSLHSWRRIGERVRELSMAAEYSVDGLDR